MLGYISGEVTRLEHLCLPGVYRVWFSAHQLDLEVKYVFRTTVRSKFQEPLHALIGYLRRQTNLKAQMGTVCQTVAKTR